MTKSKSRRAKVFVVHHAYETDDAGEETKLIGVFSMNASAKSAVASLLDKPGFAIYPKEFVIDAYEVDRIHWEEGFVSVAPVKRRSRKGK